MGPTYQNDTKTPQTPQNCADYHLSFSSWMSGPTIAGEMAQIYSLGDYDAATTSAKSAQLMNSIPKMQHKYPEVPTSPIVKQMRMVDESVEEAMLEVYEEPKLPAHLRYCRSCFSLSRDLSVFSTEQERVPTESTLYIRWKAEIRELSNAAEKGCSFCSFMACRFFNDTGLLHVWTSGIEQPKPPLGCCTLNEVEVPEVRSAVNRLRSLEQRWTDGYFTFLVQPTDFSPEKQTYTKLRFLAETTNTGDAGVKEILGFRRDLTIEIYRTPGALMPFRP